MEWVRMFNVPSEELKVGDRLLSCRLRPDDPRPNTRWGWEGNHVVDDSSPVGPVPVPEGHTQCPDGMGWASRISDYQSDGIRSRMYFDILRYMQVLYSGPVVNATVDIGPRVIPDWPKDCPRCGRANSAVLLALTWDCKYGCFAP